jgi:hypothetical protein
MSGLENFKGNKLSKEEKVYRLKLLKESVKENDVDKEMIPFLDKINNIEYFVTTQCCCGHNGDNNRIPHIDFRSTFCTDTVIDYILRPMEDKFGCNIQIFTEQNRLRYCIWMDNSNWKEQMLFLINLIYNLSYLN